MSAQEGEILWDTNAPGSSDTGEYYMQVQNDGNVVIADGRGGVVWSTNTQQPQSPQQQEKDEL